MGGIRKQGLALRAKALDLIPLILLMDLTELSKDINAKLDNIHAVLGFILEKTNLIPNAPIINVPIYNPAIDVPEEILISQEQVNAEVEVSQDAGRINDEGDNA